MTTASQSGTEPERARTNPNLTANLRGDYEALQNDLEQANQLAADFQRQLAGKSNEMAHLKQLFAKTAGDLEKLQQGITALREERHRLANEAMRGMAMEHRAKRIEAENERLRTEVAEADRRAHDRELQIAELTAELEHLRPLAAGRAVPPNGAEVRAVVTAATDALERLRELVETKGAAPQTRRPAADGDFIDIQFES